MEQMIASLRRFATPGHLQMNTTASILVTLLISGILVSIVAKLYLKYYRGFGKPQSTAMTMVLLAMITSCIIMAIGGNLALSLGMVGALSIVRYRTAVKDMRDLAYLFWAIAIGLCCGAGSYRLAVIMTATIAVVVLALEWFRLHHPNLQSYVLIIHSEPKLNISDIAKAIPLKFETKSSVVSKLSGSQETTFVVNISRDSERSSLENALKGLKGVQGYQILSPNHEILG